MGIIDNTKLSRHKTGPAPPNRLQTGKAEIFADYFLKFLAHLIAILSKNVVDGARQSEGCDDDNHGDGGKELSAAFILPALARTERSNSGKGLGAN